MSTFKNKNSLTTIEAQIAQKLKNNEARPKFTGPYKKKPCFPSKVFPRRSAHVRLLCMCFPVHLQLCSILM